MLSLKLFFNRKGWVVNGLLIAGALGHFMMILKLPDQWDQRGDATSMLYLLFVILAASLGLMRLIPWYGWECRGVGIEEHFEKIMVPVAYLLGAGFFLNLVFDSFWFFFLLVDLFFLVTLSVNGTLLYYHFVDTDRSPPSVFSSSVRRK